MKSMSESAQRAKKSLGQNFLQDANIARKIVRTLDIGPQDSVLEIGPGPGALTSIILDAEPRRLVLVEKDTYWAGERMRLDGPRRGVDSQEPLMFPGSGALAMPEDGLPPDGRFSVLVADALSIPWKRFSTPWKFIGNLPYNVASPLMWEIFSRAGGLQKAVFMVQKEVGQRIVAKPSTSAYGALSVWIQSFVAPTMEFIVPPQVFRPRPKVDSAVLSFLPLQRKGAEDRPAFPPGALAATLHFCFQRRRKQLGGIVKAAGGPEGWSEELDIDPTLRPEALSVEIFHKLARTGIFSRKGLT